MTQVRQSSKALHFCAECGARGCVARVRDFGPVTMEQHARVIGAANEMEHDRDRLRELLGRILASFEDDTIDVLDVQMTVIDEIREELR